MRMLGRKKRSFPGTAPLKRARRKVARVTPKGRAASRRRRTLAWVTAGIGAGATLTYFFDPKQGRERRTAVRRRAAGALRRTGNGLNKARVGVQEKIVSIRKAS